MFVRYLRDLFGNVKSIAFIFAGFISTAMTFVPLYFPAIHLPRWISAAIAIIAFLLAPFRLYAIQKKRIAALESHAQPPRKAELVVKPEGIGCYLRVVDDHTNRKVIALYLEPRVSLENKGTRNAVIESYDLRFPGLQEIQEQSKVRPRPFRESDFVPALSASHGFPGGNDYVRGYIDVPAERLVGPLRIPFLIEGSIPEQLYEKNRDLQCVLTIHDTEGNSVSASLILYQKG